MVQSMAAFAVVKLVLDVIEQLADRVLPRRQAVDKSLQFLTRQLFKIFDLSLS